MSDDFIPEVLTASEERESITNRLRALEQERLFMAVDREAAAELLEQFPDSPHASAELDTHEQRLALADARIAKTRELLAAVKERRAARKAEDQDAPKSRSQRRARR